MMSLAPNARNILIGKVVKVVDRAVNCEVTLEIAPDSRYASQPFQSWTPSLIR
jgi:molybdopterin-binding protein